MTKKPASLRIYGRRITAERYHRRGGFAADRKRKLLEVSLELLLALTEPGDTLLELGAGTGHFTQMILATKQLGKIDVTDGAPAMLQLAKDTLPNEDGQLRFDLLDFETAWVERYKYAAYDAVTSTMALHHAANKRRLFEQIHTVLKPGGVLVLGDHMAAGSELGQYLIDRERACVKLGREQAWDDESIRQQIQIDKDRKKIEGDRCEPVAHYLTYLADAGFAEVDCLWQDYWLAVFVARKAGQDE